MTELRVGDQVIRFDREATVSAYAEVQQGWADRCNCSGCRNFARLRDRTYPGAFIELLGRIGIDSTKEGEAIHHGPKGNLHVYGGWFYFVGEIIEFGERLTSVGENFQYWFSKAFGHPPESFQRPIMAVEFETDLPWVLEAPWDPTADTQMMKAEDVMARYSNTLRKLAKPQES